MLMFYADVYDDVFMLIFYADVYEDVLMLMLAIFLELFFFFVLGGPEWGFHWRPSGFSLSGGKQILFGIRKSNRGG